MPSGATARLVADSLGEAQAARDDAQSHPVQRTAREERQGPQPADGC